MVDPCICAARLSYINYQLNSEVFITLRCQLCSTCYTAVRIKKCSKVLQSIIKLAIMINTDDFYYERKPSHVISQN